MERGTQTLRCLQCPTFLTILRALGIPLFLWALFDATETKDGIAIAILVIAGITDYLDGRLARALNQSSRLGELLDPLVDRLYIAAVVIGWPVNMNGTIGPQCEKVEKFSERLAKICNIPICSWDERLSTMAVHRTMIEADLSRKKQKEVVDKMAAAYMLQGFLDSLRG